jgi:two-component system chemotaxis response regulator CheY
MRHLSSPGAERDRTVLVVDDSGYTRARVRDQISSLGFRVVEADDGDSAIAAFVKHRPLVVVIDQVMRGLSGIDASRALLARDPGARVILLTAINDEGLRQQAITIGVVDVLSKSDLGRLKSAVSDLMDESFDD